MSTYGVGIASVMNDHELRIMRGKEQSHAWFAGPIPGGEELNTEQGGQQYPVFVLSVHDPDSATARWVL